MIRRAPPLRLFFSKRRNGAVNFGDNLCEPLVGEILGRAVQHARVSTCDLAAMGSIVEMLVERRFRRIMHGRLDPIAVWGSGFLRAGGTVSVRQLRPIAVRGPLTCARLGAPAVPLGDPGLLATRLIHSPIGKTHRWGVVPHYTDANSPLLADLLDRCPNAILIPVDAPPLETLRLIASCEFIASSSLHGLVAADAYNIPNWRIALDGGLDGGDYKFTDYAEAIGRSDTTAHSVAEGLEPLVKTSNTCFEYFGGIAAIADGLEHVLVSSFG
jgi:pyruvyltransferase